ncbi:hypothetical protein [Streptacidiphilus rugosus]|uniref:hypothetical protein n=1 Tax=Streptacidiphilus rugosus TaxID=405783 RepID=UPI000565BAC7|nr:hypothetical protein [Streptacidiphilus rugosus]
MGVKVGPLWFMAPEMRKMSGEEDGRQADVYSLAHTLSAFILSLGTLPLPGTFRAGTEEYDLNRGWKGDHDALDALEHVLEAATRNEPQDRLSIRDLAQELGVWLSAARVPLTRNHGFRTGWGPMDDYERDAAETQRIMQSAVAALARTVGNTNGGDVPQPRASELWLRTYDWQPNSPEGFESDGTLTVAVERPDGTRRAVLGAAFWGRDVSFIAEVQRRTQGGCELEHGWPESDWARARLPSATAALKSLTERVLQHL